MGKINTMYSTKNSMEKYPVSEQIKLKKNADKNGRSSELRRQSVFLILLSITNTILIRYNLLCMDTSGI